MVAGERREGALAFDTKGEYTISGARQISGYVQVINCMPANDRPDMFGLHSLADVKLRHDQANKIFHTIVDVQPKEIAIGGRMREDLVIQKIRELLPAKPGNSDIEHVLAGVDRLLQAGDRAHARSLEHPLLDGY
jgi:hypothetical protein